MNEYKIGAAPSDKPENIYRSKSGAKRKENPVKRLRVFPENQSGGGSGNQSKNKRMAVSGSGKIKAKK